MLVQGFSINEREGWIRLIFKQCISDGGFQEAMASIQDIQAIIGSFIDAYGLHKRDGINE